jgi:hypothetical protein
MAPDHSNSLFANTPIGFVRWRMIEKTTDLIKDLFTCNQRGDLYNSEHELHEHQEAAHHADVCDRQPKISY